MNCDLPVIIFYNVVVFCVGYNNFLNIISCNDTNLTKCTDQSQSRINSCENTVLTHK